MDEKRTLIIDPKAFSYSNNTTRKKRTPSTDKPAGEIKVRREQNKKKDSLKKKSILNMIRQHQEDRYKTLFSNDSARKPPPTADESDSFNKEFQEAQAFMENIVEKTKNQVAMQNYTLKNRNYSAETPVSLLMAPTISIDQISENINLELPPAFSTPPLKLALPKYGCLKGGSLPTYRSYMNNATQKNYGHSAVPFPQPAVQVRGPIQSPVAGHSVMPLPPTLVMATGGQANPPAIIHRATDIQQTAAKLHEMKRNSRPMQKKRKKTLRRTYKIGKSKVFPRISVLVSNKTLRNNISTKTQLLKQTSIPEVKKYLIKRGFIKIGSTAPNDVLRKMYESATMICGEVQNHNPDNLLYNFLNGDGDAH